MMGKVLVNSTDVNHVQKKLFVAIKQYLRFFTSLVFCYYFQL